MTVDKFAVLVILLTVVSSWIVAMLKDDPQTIYGLLIHAVVARLRSPIFQSLMNARVKKISTLPWITPMYRNLAALAALRTCPIYWNGRLATFLKSDLFIFIRWSRTLPLCWISGLCMVLSRFSDTPTFLINLCGLCRDPYVITEKTYNFTTYSFHDAMVDIASNDSLLFPEGALCHSYYSFVFQLIICAIWCYSSSKALVFSYLHYFLYSFYVFKSAW